MNRRAIALNRRRSPIVRGRQPVGSRSREADEASDQIDESLQETFPASDPPSRTVLIRIGAPGAGAEASNTVGHHGSRRSVDEQASMKTRVRRAARYSLDEG
jgi:hypothetical protein